MTYVFTISTISYLAQATSLANSCVDHNPDFKAIVFLLDKLDDIPIPIQTTANIIEVEGLQLEWFQEMVSRYTIFELSNALKPFLAEWILTTKELADAVIYLDSDIQVFGSFDLLQKLLNDYSVILTPHTFSPIPDDGRMPNEKLLFKSGIFNGGCFAVSNVPEAIEFLSWWKGRLRYYCLFDLQAGLFVDQMWLNLAPLYFEKIYILKNSGYNVAYWNMHERKVQIVEGKYVVNDLEPLVFFHFSGYDVRLPDLISKHQNRFYFESNAGNVRSLFTEFRKKILENGFEQLSKVVSRYDGRLLGQRQKKGLAVQKSGISNMTNLQMDKFKRTRIFGFARKIIKPLLLRVGILQYKHEEIFSKIYNDGVWGKKDDQKFYSGTGSDEEYANQYASVIQTFIQEHEVKSIVDLGCGDFRVGRKITRTSDVEYIGVDVVNDVIKYNNANYKSDKIHFECLNIVSDKLPKGELCLIRQVLQHLSNTDIKRILTKCSRFKYLIVTEHQPIVLSEHPNMEKQPDALIRLAQQSAIYLDKDPFNKQIEELLTVFPEAEPGSKIVTFRVTL